MGCIPPCCRRLTSGEGLRCSNIQAPFTVGEIALDAGPLVRAVLVGDEPFAIGDRVRSKLWSTTAPSAPAPAGDDRGLWSRTVNADNAGAADEMQRWELRFEKALP